MIWSRVSNCISCALPRRTRLIRALCAGMWDESQEKSRTIRELENKFEALASKHEDDKARSAKKSATLQTQINSALASKSSLEAQVQTLRQQINDSKRRADEERERRQAVEAEVVQLRREVTSAPAFQRLEGEAIELRTENHQVQLPSHAGVWLVLMWALNCVRCAVVWCS